ncbi:hypothetical protein [Gordonia phthalatica]|uniref:MmpS family membrane protein n=1 Tax=Gordonia phthalatica TaxID=1136941 RepID=A0A0N9NLR1_9ACTN|nr:hypothetical protein [Gordonia phthalatica]ALG87056.1 hypothetical protein ACH46_19455 [Gordonia phthalatica]
MSDSSGGRTRTVLLSLVVILAVVVLGLVGFLVFGQQLNDPGSDQAATTTGTTTTPTTATTEETTTASPTPTSEHTRPTAEPGSVTYQLTGSGDVVALAFRTDNGREVVAATGTPWSNRTTVSDREVEMTAMVVRGVVTCTILQGDELVASSTSRGGPLRCAGKLPR